jgi:uncharacterized Zn finger protein (UPF0148 family)
MELCKICGAILIEEIDGFLLGFLLCPYCKEFRNGTEERKDHPELFVPED